MYNAWATAAHVDASPLIFSNISTIYTRCDPHTAYVTTGFICDGWSKSFIRKRQFFANKNVTFAKLSWTPCLSTAGPMLGNNASYEDSFTTCQITPENPGSLLDSLLKMQLASHGIHSQGRLLLTSFFFARFTDPPLSTCTLTFARSFAELSRNFRESFPIHTDPGHQQGAHWRKREHQGPWWLALAMNLFLETSKSIIRQWQRQVQGCASGPWCLAVAKPHLWKLGCYLWRARWMSKSTTAQGTEPKPNRNSLVPSPAGPRAAVGGSPLYNDYNI